MSCATSAEEELRAELAALRQQLNAKIDEGLTIAIQNPPGTSTGYGMVTADKHASWLLAIDLLLIGFSSDVKRHWQMLGEARSVSLASTGGRDAEAALAALHAQVSEIVRHRDAVPALEEAERRARADRGGAPDEGWGVDDAPPSWQAWRDARQRLDEAKRAMVSSVHALSIADTAQAAEAHNERMRAEGAARGLTTLDKMLAALRDYPDADFSEHRVRAEEALALDARRDTLAKSRRRWIDAIAPILGEGGCCVDDVPERIEAYTRRVRAEGEDAARQTALDALRAWRADGNRNAPIYGPATHILDALRVDTFYEKLLARAADERGGQ